MTSQTAATAPENLAPALHAVEAFVFRSPIESPVRTSFGVMRDRPAVFVRITDVTGRAGWGRSGATFPVAAPSTAPGSSRRCLRPGWKGDGWTIREPFSRSLRLRPRLWRFRPAKPGLLPARSRGSTLRFGIWRPAVRASRCGAIWAAPARKFGFTAAASTRTIPAGWLRRTWRSAIALSTQGGFGEARDLGNLAALRATLPAGSELMVDANQAWNLDTALHMAERMAESSCTGWKSPCVPTVPGASGKSWRAIVHSAGGGRKPCRRSAI